VDPTGEVAVADDVAVLVVLGGLATYAYLSSPAGQRAVQDSVTWAASGAGIFGNRRDSLYDFPSVPVGSSNTTIPQFPSRELQYNHQGAPATYQESSDTFSPSITDKALEYAPFTFPQLDVKDYAHLGTLYLSTEDKTRNVNGDDPTRKDFRDAKRAAGIPTSIGHITHKYVRDKQYENRTVYDFGVLNKGIRFYIIKHAEDKFGRRPHYHGANNDSQKGGDPMNPGRYNQFPGHFPED